MIHKISLDQLEDIWGQRQLFAQKTTPSDSLVVLGVWGGINLNKSDLIYF